MKLAGRRVLVGVSLALILCLGLYAYYFTQYVRSYEREPGARPALTSAAGRSALGDIALAVPGRLIGVFRSPLVPQLRLELKTKDFEQISAKREQALERRFLISSRADYVPARLHHEGREFKVRVRLKGDLTDHLLGDKWSYRVVVRGGESVLGMRRFSLQAPYTRDHQAEPLFLDFLREQGVLAPRYFFVDLSVNGRSLGRMALEEHFETELLEHQQRREGVIIRFDERHFYAAEAAFMRLVPDYDNWRNTPLDVYRRRRVEASPVLSAQQQTAFGLLRGLAENQLQPSQALDVDSWARFLAACEIWSRPHLTHWNNLRMYLNPFTLRLEPIGFDAAGEEATTPILHCMGGAHPMMTTLIRDPILRGAFLRRLQEAVKRVGSAEFASWLEQREAHYLPQLTAEFPWLRPLSLDRMRERASILARINEANFESYLSRAPERVMTHEPGADYPIVVHAGLQRSAAGDFVELASAISRPVTVTALWAERRGERREVHGGGGGLFVQLEATPWPQAPKRVRVNVELPERSPGEWRLLGEARVEGHSHRFEVHPSAATLRGPALPNATLAEVLARHPFLREQTPAPGSSQSWLVADSGSFDVEGSLILPPGLGLRIGPATQLRFAPGELLLARGPLVFEGSASEPIVLEAQQGSWDGIVHLGSPTPSHWAHVVVRRTRGISRGAWQLTGGVTFRRTQVSLEDCSFEDSTAEDALNLVRCEVKLRRVSVRNTASDAIDFDFCSGDASEIRVVGAGGDGLDAAGSRLSFEAVRLERIGDKAISIGEGSQVRVSAAWGRECDIGVASKDGSEARVVSSSFEQVRVAGLMAYTKKSAYGPATLTAEDIRIQGPGRRAIAQIGSRIWIDSQPVEPEALDVEAIYHPEEAAQ